MAAAPPSDQLSRAAAAAAVDFINPFRPEFTEKRVNYKFVIIVFFSGFLVVVN
jgi:hypothetical protein